MKTIIRTSRLTLLASLIATTALSSACSSQQVKPAPAPLEVALEHNVIDATPRSENIQDTSSTDSIPMVTDVTLVTSANISPEPPQIAEVDISDDAPDTAMDVTDTTRPGRLVFHFGFNQSQLDEENRQIVEEHGRFLAEHPEIKLVINGHSDTQGNSHYNDILALKRAEHVANLLTEQGVMKEQIEILSWGSSAPLADAHHHRDQRRVELNYVDEYLAQSRAE